MKSAEIRQSFLDFFAGHGHTVVPSANVVPERDPTLYFVNAGMVPFKDVFTGADTRPYSRAVSAQKCLRVSGKHNDLDEVGRTPRHHTLFEMLGNFSFGDYFKAQAIPLAWEWLTEVLELDPARLWVTIHHSDDEAFDLWRSNGFPAERLQRLGDKDNFWSMGPVGPCGPCSEIHFDHGPAFGPAGGPATESDRYVEIWNLVFMQFDQQEDGTRILLPKPSIDTGSGLERVAAAMQGVYSNYETDLFKALIARAAQEAQVPYGRDVPTDTALQVIADHARAAAFLVADGVMPSNEGRGYVLRRIMRRAIRFGVKLELDRPFLHLVADEVRTQMGEAYPELEERSGFVSEVIQGEEDRFRLTLDRGMQLLDGTLEQVGEGGTIPGDVAFKLYDTYGFPVDLTGLIAAERGISVDEEGFSTEMEAQKARGRAAWKGSGDEEVVELWHRLVNEHGATTFTGYEAEAGTAPVIALIRKSEDGYEEVSTLTQGQQGVLLAGATPFYAESGGQMGDTGRIRAGESEALVTDTTKAAGLHLHHLTVESGSLSVGDEVELVVDGATRRVHIRRNHTATHLLHAALRTVLGEHVAQKGSLVAPDRLRFDFSHHKGVKAKELRRIEDLVNAHVLADEPVNTELMDLDEAKEAGAMALFGEKYDQQVRVVSVPGWSTELCGGTHVGRTGEIGLFRFTSESAVAAGIRRVEAVTGEGALALVRQQSKALDEAATALKTRPEELVDAIGRLQAEKKKVEKELAALQVERARDAAGDLVSQARDFGGVKVLAAEFDGDLREQADRLRDQLGTALVVLFAKRGAKVQLVAAATKDVAGKKVHAGNVIRAIAGLVGGGGGGRPDMAQAGGKNPDGIPAAMEAVYAWAEENL